jgi:phosphate transport system substrate-binding protein
MLIKKILLPAIIAVGVAATVFAAGQSKITIKGSDTMVILAQKWAEIFMKKNAETSVQVTGGGSGTGFAALINGTTDICNASRPIKEKEIAQIRQKFNTAPIEIKTAIDGIALYLNEANGVNELTIAQIRDIFTGKIVNWKDVGGQNAKIIVYGRENSSGTYDFFKEHVLLNNDFALQVQTLPGTAAVVNAVGKDKFGIGYGGTAYSKGIKLVKVKKDAATDGVLPTEENIKGGKYPVSRYLYMYVLKKPEGDMKKFIDWVLSKEGQLIVSDVGYFPLK